MVSHFDSDKSHVSLFRELYLNASNWLLLILHVNGVLYYRTVEIRPAQKPLDRVWYALICHKTIITGLLNLTALATCSL